MSKIKLQCKLYMAIQTKKRSSDTSQNRIQAKSNSKKKKKEVVLFNKYLLSTYHIPGIMLGAGATWWTNTKTFTGLTFQREEIENKII